MAGSRSRVRHFYLNMGSDSARCAFNYSDGNRKAYQDSILDKISRLR